MIISPEIIRDFHRKNIYFRSIIPYTQMPNATLIMIDKYNHPMKLVNIGPTILTCKVPPINEPNMVESIKLNMRNMGRKWILVSEYGEAPSNKDRTTCFRCGCPTEFQRDFLTFTVRLFCPRCHI